MEPLTTAAGATPGRPTPGPILAAQLPAFEALIVIGRTFAHLSGADLQHTSRPRYVHVRVPGGVAELVALRLVLAAPPVTLAAVAIGARRARGGR